MLYFNKTFIEEENKDLTLSYFTTAAVGRTTSSMAAAMKPVVTVSSWAQDSLTTWHHVPS